MKKGKRRGEGLRVRESEKKQGVKTATAPVQNHSSAHKDRPRAPHAAQHTRLVTCLQAIRTKHRQDLIHCRQAEDASSRAYARCARTATRAPGPSHGPWHTPAHRYGLHHVGHGVCGHREQHSAGLELLVPGRRVVGEEEALLRPALQLGQ